MNSIRTITQNKACCGCGACTVMCPIACINFVYGERYNFPEVDASKCTECGQCLKVCPSAFLMKGSDPGFVDEPINESYNCFLIHTKDEEVRIGAASGGFITGIILHLMDKGLVDGGIVAKCEGQAPLVAEPFIAVDKASILRARGSKYTPVSSCTVLREVIETPGQYVFVGTPCMLEGLTRLQKYFPELKQSIPLNIGFVCSGTASRRATKAYIEEDGGVNIKDVRRICYRGNGWPGRFRVFGETDNLLMDRPYIGGSLTHVVSKDHYLRCENCLDHWARYADIVVSDPWTQEMVMNEKKGRSAIMVRTERGQKAVDSAIDSGNFIAERITINNMLSYNMHLSINTRHPRHSWMALYQLLFFGRVKYMLPILRKLLHKDIVGVQTTLKALFNKNYY